MNTIPLDELEPENKRSSIAAYVVRFVERGDEGDEVSLFLHFGDRKSAMGGIYGPRIKTSEIKKVPIHKNARKFLPVLAHISQTEDELFQLFDDALEIAFEMGKTAAQSQA